MHAHTQPTSTPVTRKASIGALLAVALAVAVTLAACAQAKANSVQISVPKHARAATWANVTITGFATEKARLYSFAESDCGPNPAVAYARMRAQNAGGVYWHYVKGAFTETSSVKAPHAGRQTVCVYLQASSEDLNSRGGVLADAFASYHVQH